MTRLALDPTKLEKLLTEKGWTFVRIADDTWRSQFRGKSGRFPIFVKLGAEQVVFAVLPFLRSPQDKSAAEKLYQRLLELNQSVMMAKFSIDDDLDVVLSVEYPVADLDRSEFDDALDTLTYYADRHFEELKALAG